jgi:transposase
MMRGCGKGILSTGCQWRARPQDSAARSTVNHYYHRWQWDGTLDRIHHELYMKCRDLIRTFPSFLANPLTEGISD